MTEFVTAYGKKTKTTLICQDQSLTKQSHQKECDINFIVNRFQKTGLLEHARQAIGQYGEFTPIDFHEAMNMVTKAQEMFDALPSKIRAQFGNDPGAFMDFATNPDNKKTMESMGLLEIDNDFAPAHAPEEVVTPPAGQKPE